MGRASILSKPDAVRALVRYVEAYGRSAVSRPSSPSLGEGRDSLPPASITSNHPRLAAAVDALEQIAPDDAKALASIARVMFDAGDAQGARTMYERLLERHGSELGHVERGDAQWRLGESLRRVGELDKAVDHLREAADADPGSPEPLRALARVYEQTGDWEEYVRTKHRRLEVASGAERFELLLEIGDAEFSKLNDRGRATKTYVAALEERPDDRKLLTKLMQLYSEEKDWAKLVEVVLRLADFVEDPKQRAKYMHTAAIVASRQLGEIDQALSFYDRALEFDAHADQGARRGDRAASSEGGPRRRRAHPQAPARRGQGRPGSRAHRRRARPARGALSQVPERARARHRRARSRPGLRPRR